MNDIKLLSYREIKEYETDRFSRPLDLMFDYASDKVLGGNLSVAESFRYIFRRFGLPNFEHDSEKQLCAYMLSTKLKDLCVYVSLSSIVSFYPTIKGELKVNIEKEIAERAYQTTKNMCQWALKQHNVSIFYFDYDAAMEGLVSHNNILVYLGDDEFNIADKVLPKVMADFQEYLKKEELGSISEDEQDDIFWNQYSEYKYSQEMHYRKLYFNDIMSDKWGEYYFNLLPKESYTRKAYDAYLDFLNDMLEPVFTRDVAHNILGDL